MFALSFSSVTFHTKTSLTSLPADISQTAVCICMRATRGEQPTRLLLEKSRTEEAKRSKGTLTGKHPSIASGLLCFLSTASYRPIPLRPLFFLDNCVLLLQLLTKKNRFISSRLVGVLFLWHERTRTRTPLVMWLSARSLFLRVWQPKRLFFFGRARLRLVCVRFKAPSRARPSAMVLWCNDAWEGRWGICQWATFDQFLAMFFFCVYLFFDSDAVWIAKNCIRNIFFGMQFEIRWEKEMSFFSFLKCISIQIN